ncbi:MAG: thioredoxin domain-containing protein [Patescibacteria group bacterium]|nr:thioredoxin domain-containing protein [Patescibacteria group bacterium]
MENKSPFIPLLVILLIGAAYFIGVQTTKVQYLEKINKNAGKTAEAPKQETLAAKKLNISQSIGMDKNKFKSCLESGKYTQKVTDDLGAGKKVGVTGTPATFINGQMVSGAMPYSAFKTIIDQELKNPNQPLTTGERVNVDPGSLPALGKPDAPVTIIEFADYQCPFCERYYTDAEKNIMEDYVKTGKVKFIFRNYAFLGPESILAAEGGYCAAEQGKFWEYHNFLYEHQGPENSGTFSKENLE